MVDLTRIKLTQFSSIHQPISVRKKKKTHQKIKRIQAKVNTFHPNQIQIQRKSRDPFHQTVHRQQSNTNPSRKRKKQKESDRNTSKTNLSKKNRTVGKNTASKGIKAKSPKTGSDSSSQSTKRIFSKKPISRFEGFRGESCLAREEDLDRSKKERNFIHYRARFSVGKEIKRSSQQELSREGGPLSSTQSSHKGGIFWLIQLWATSFFSSMMQLEDFGHVWRQGRFVNNYLLGFWKKDERICF